MIAPLPAPSPFREPLFQAPLMDVIGGPSENTLRRWRYSRFASRRRRAHEACLRRIRRLERELGIDQTLDAKIRDTLNVIYAPVKPAGLAREIIRASRRYGVYR